MKPCHVIAVTDDGAPCLPSAPAHRPAICSRGRSVATGRRSTRTTREGYVLVGVTSEGYGKGETPTFHLVCKHVEQA